MGRWAPKKGNYIYHNPDFSLLLFTTKAISKRRMLYVNEILSQMLFCFVFNRDNEEIYGKIRNTGDTSQTSFHFPDGQVEQASAPGMNKKWRKRGGDKRKLEKGDPLFLIFPTHSHCRSLCVLLEMNVSYAGQLLETLTNLKLGIITSDQSQ